MAKKVEGFPRSIPNVNEACWMLTCPLGWTKIFLKTYSFFVYKATNYFNKCVAWVNQLIMNGKKLRAFLNQFLMSMKRFRMLTCSTAFRVNQNVEIFKTISLLSLKN